MVNDFELIYLYKQNREETVLQEIIDKYRPLIYKNIYKFYVKQQDIEDFYQEGVLALLQTIEVFNEDVGKTFTKFYELILRSEEHTSELQSRENLVCRLLL